MKSVLLILFTILLAACNDGQVKNETTPVGSVTNTITGADTSTTDKHPPHQNDTVSIINQERNWQQGFGLTHDPVKDSIWFKPVNYYLTDKACSALAIDFYYGRLRPSDDSITDELLKLAVTDNSKLRPFYRWCLNKTIVIQDGALGEHTGMPARRYAEKFPKDFFEYMDIDTSGQKLVSWTNSISYSGFYDAGDDYKKPKDIRKRMSAKMKKNCKDCDEILIKRIEEFSIACFN